MRKEGRHPLQRQSRVVRMGLTDHPNGKVHVQRARLLPGRAGLFLMLALAMVTCKKFEAERLILIRTLSVEEITGNSCVATGTLLDLGEPAGVDQHGFAWSTGPDLENGVNYVQLGSTTSKGTYSGTISGLASNTRYYVWAYAAKGEEKEYGESRSFQTTAQVTPSLATLSTQPVGEITSTSAHSGGLISSDGGSEITARGVCWNTSTNPTPDQFSTNDGTGTGEYGSDLTGLSPGTKYYVRAYAVNGVGTAYGNEVSFTTGEESAPPQVSTGTVEAIGWNEATVSGNVTGEGGSEVSERGICWGPDQDPAVSGSHIASGGGPGEFVVVIPELEPETSYYARAYAINSGGISYGANLQFNTLPLPSPPEVVTGTVTGIETSGIVISNSSIVSDGGAPILAKGLCWDTGPNPTLDNASLEFGMGPDPFTMEVQGLYPDTEYHIRAYATNSAQQTGYGEDVVVKTLFLCGSVLVDTRDGNEYATVQIGEQCWMARNLKAGVMIDTSSLFADNGTVEKKCYDNNPENCNQFGGLYSWNEMMQYTDQEGTRGVCPDGWHLPSDGEWRGLELQLGMAPESADSTGWRGYGNEGGKLKSTDPLWAEPNVGATNESQFNALPSGMVWSTNNSNGLGVFAVFWTSSPTTEEWAWYRYLENVETRIYRVEGYRMNTTSVRCVKD